MIAQPASPVPLRAPPLLLWPSDVRCATSRGSRARRERPDTRGLTRPVLAQMLDEPSHSGPHGGVFIASAGIASRRCAMELLELPPVHGGSLQPHRQTLPPPPSSRRDHRERLQSPTFDLPQHRIGGARDSPTARWRTRYAGSPWRGFGEPVSFRTSCHRPRRERARPERVLPRCRGKPTRISRRDVRAAPPQRYRAPPVNALLRQSTVLGDRADARMFDAIVAEGSRTPQSASSSASAGSYILRHAAKRLRSSGGVSRSPDIEMYTSSGASAASPRRLAATGCPT